jgi:hypothetical protein
VFYPRPLAPGTMADDLEWREASRAVFERSVSDPGITLLKFEPAGEPQPGAER